MTRDLEVPTPGASRPTRRSMLTAALAGTGLVALGGTAQAATVHASPDAFGAAGPAGRRPRILVATNEPWGTYHVRPLMAEADRRGWSLTQLVPDLSGVGPDDPVPVATLEDAPEADLLVVTGAEDWPADCAAALDRLPIAASSLAYLNPVEAARAAELAPLRTVTASSPAEGRAFSEYLGTRRRVRVVGSPQTDTLPVRAPEPGTILVLTSVTRADDTGGAAPGTELLLAAAAELAAAGRHVLVGLHPREDRTLWDDYEISEVPSLQASGRAEAAIGIPGTVFPLIAAAGTPVVGCTDPALEVPEYLRRVCSSTIDSATDAVTAVDDAVLPDAATMADVVGPVGGSAGRLLGEWARVARPRR